MFTREMYIDGVVQEGNILKHLYSKVKPEMLDYRPTPGQRSMQELLDFLPCNAAPIAHAVITGDWATIGEAMKKVQEDARKDFCGTLDREIARFSAMINEIPFADFDSKRVTLPTGQTVKLGNALLGFNYKFLAAYRMQLFLYLKACGRAELNTANCWMGVDMEMPRN